MEVKMYLVAAGIVLMLGTVTAQLKCAIIGTGHVFLSTSSETAVIFCGINPDGIVVGTAVWKKDGTDVTAKASLMVPSSMAKSTIRFTPSTDQNIAGDYTCEVPTKAAKSDVWKISVETPQKPRLACETVEVGKTAKCACISGNHPEIRITEFELKVNDKTETAGGTNTPKNEISVKLTKELVGKSVKCKAKYESTNAFSPEASTKLEAGPGCPSCPTCGCVKVAGVPLMTLGLVLLLSTVLMKE